MAFTYRQVKDLYDVLQSSGAVTKSLPEWSDEMNQSTGTDLYGEGLHDNFVKRGSVGIDKLLEATGLPDLTGSFGRSVGEAVGAPDAGESIGHGLPRMALNFLPVVAAEALSGGAATPLLAAGGLFGTGALSGAETYTQTGSPAAGLLSGATAAALPYATGRIEQGILGKLGARKVSGPLANSWTKAGTPDLSQGTTAIKQLFPTTFGQKAGAFLGGQAGAAGIMEASGLAQDALAGQPLHNPFSVETALNLTLGQAPFALLHLGKSAFGKATESPIAHADRLEAAISQTRQAMVVKQAMEGMKQKSAISTIPIIPETTLDPKIAEETRDILSKNRLAQSAIVNKETITPEEGQQLKELVTQDENLQPKVEPTADTVLGAELPVDAPRTPLYGTKVLKPDGTPVENEKWVKYLVAEDPRNPPELVGKKVSFSKGKFYQEPPLGQFSIPTDPSWYTVHPEEAPPKPRIIPGQPELPQQAKEFSHQEFLAQLETAVDSAMTPVQHQKIVNDLRALQSDAGMEPIRDMQLNRVMAKLISMGVGDKPIKAALKRELSKTRRRLEAQTTGTETVAGQIRAAGSNAIEGLGAETTGTKATSDGPQAVVKLPKENESTAAVHNFLDEVMVGAQAEKDATASFEAWRKNTTSKDTTSLPIEAERFRLFWKMEQEGDLGNGIELTDEEAKLFNERLKSESLDVKDPSVLKDFPERDHVLNWMDAVDVRVKAMLRKNEGNTDNPFAPGEADVRRQTPAGGPFVWNMASYDEVRNRLGDKHTVPKSGEVPLDLFKRIAGRGKPLRDSEIQLMQALDKVVGGGAFEGGNVKLKELTKVLKENPVVVESHVYGQEGKSSPAKEKFDELTHTWFDELPGGLRTWIERGETLEDMKKMVGDDPTAIRDIIYSEDFPTKVEEYNKLGDRVREEFPNGAGVKATQYYNTISPFDTKKYPVVRVDVVLPRQLSEGGRIAKEAGGQPLGKDLWAPDNLHENLPNTLGWAMVQFVPVNGETVMFVGEQQSRWGQARAKLEKSIKNVDKLDSKLYQIEFRNGDKMNVEASSEKEAKDNALSQSSQSQTHPLLEAQHILVLKAAIAEAEKRGVTKMILSDGETAMMTEGHDKAVSSIVEGTDENIQKAKDLLAKRRPGQEYVGNSELLYRHLEAFVNGKDLVVPRNDTEVRKLFQVIPDKISQEGGMRLHYDTTLPSAAGKLTGDRGEPVDLGPHKNAQSEIVEGMTNGSPVFKNPDGSPKVNVTGRMFDLTKAQETFDQQGGFTLGDPSRAPEPDVPYVPKEDKDLLVQKALTGDGTSLTSWLGRSSNPEMRAIVSDLTANFPELLKRITSGIYDIQGTHAIRGEASQVHIKFDPSILTMANWARENTALHELIHGLTIHELDSPTVRPELVEQLTALREKAISALPKAMKDLYNTAIKSDWIGKYSRGEIGYETLGKTLEERQVIYALLNNREFTAQAFSSPSFRAYLQGIEGKTGVWKSFVNWTRQLLRLGDKVSGTALGQAMELTHQIMANGEYVLGVKDFGERYFENQGKGGTYGESQTLRGLGIIGESASGISKDELISSLSIGEGRFNPALTRARNKLEQTFAERGDEFQTLSSILDEQGHEPSVRGLDEFIETALSESRDVQDSLDLMPTTATRYIFEKLRDHKDVVGMVAAATAKSNKDLVNIAKPELLRGPVASLTRDLEKILKNENRQQEFAQVLEGLNGVEPGEFVNRAPEETEEFSGDKPQKGQSWLTNFLRPLAQTARAIPEAAEVISKGFQLAPNIRKMANEILSVYGMDISSLHLDVPPTHEGAKQVEKVVGNKRLLKMVDDWMFHNNNENRDASVMLPETHPMVAKALASATPEERAQVHDVVAKAVRQTQTQQKLVLGKMQEVAAVNGAGLLTETGLKTSQNLELAGTLLDGLLQAQDPLTQLSAQAKVQSVQSRLLPEPFLNLLKFSRGEAEKIQAWKKYFDANPAWAPAQRAERYLVVYRKGNLEKKWQASSVKEGEDFIEKTGGRKVDIIDQWKGHEDEPFAAPNFPLETAARMREIEENQIDMLKRAGILETDEDVNQFRRSSVVTQIAREAQTSLPGVDRPARGLSQGAEDLPWLWNHISNAQREAAYWSRTLLRAQARTYLKDPELSGNEQLRSQLATHFENLLHPDPIAAQKMTRLASTWFLGFNLASTIINAAQPFVTHVGELTSLTGKPVDSYRRVLRALDELGGRFIGRKEWATPEHEKFMQEAVRDSEVGIGMYDEQAEAEESTATRFKQAMMKNKVQDLGQRLSSAAGSYSTAAMWVFQHGERLNARAALLASFDLYREQGLGYEEAKQKAYEFNRAVNYSGGRAQRPIGAFSGRGAFPRTVAMMGTSLQSYVLGTTFQLARYLQKGSFRPQGLKPHEVYAARKAALQMLGTQFAAAGLLGLPFASGAIALLNQLFPDLELPKKLREGVDSFLSSDKENGSTLTDIAMTGVPSMLGWDMQSRLSMGNTLPGVSEINGFQPENLIGPAGNIIKNFVGGVQGWSRGDAGSGTRFLPPAIAKLTQLATAALNDGGEIRDYRGRPLDAPTPGEHVGQLLGFQPKRLSDQNAAGRIAEQADRVSGQREGQFRQDLAKEALKGNFGTVRTALQQRLRADKSYNPQDAVRGIAQAAEDLQFPRDLRREGSKDGRSQLLNSYSNLNSGSPSEEARYAFRQGIEGRLGLPPKSGAGLALARLMDQLKLASPQATRVELRASATALLRRTQPQLLLEPVE